MSDQQSAGQSSGRVRQLGAFLQAGVRYYLLVRLMAGFAVQIESVAIGWQIYQTTGNPFHLGLAGLTQILPAIALVLVTGDVADRFNRRTVVSICLAVEAASAIILTAIIFLRVEEIWPIFTVLFAFGTARAFFQPALQSLLPNIVTTEQLADAVALNAAIQQFTTIVGPVAGGLLFAVSPTAAFMAVVITLLAGLVFAVLMPNPLGQVPSTLRDARSLVAGFYYIWKQRVVRGVMSLDLVAVLLGGATALLPVFAQDILHVGPSGLGVLRAAPAVGAIIVACYLSLLPIRDHAGLIMLFCIFVFGASIVVFGLTETFWISALALAIMGASDMVSVYVRQTIVQLWTPDHIRGRVNAANSVFTGASNELGAFRAGSFAALWGAVPAVVFGGVVAMAAAALWTAWFPELRRVRYLSKPGDEQPIAYVIAAEERE